MKKTLIILFSSLILLFSVHANAAAISVSNASGHPGGSVSIDVSLTEGDISFGGDFTVGFDHTKLTFISIVGRTTGGYEFSPLYSDPFGSGDTFSLAYLGTTDPAGATIDPIFSISFSIITPYPSSNLPSETLVTVSGVLFDDFGGEVSLEEVTSTISVLAPETGNIPEPGALALVALSLLIMACLGQMRSLFR